MGYNTRYTLKIESLSGEKIPQCEHENPKGASFCMTCGKQIRELDAVDAVWEFIENDDDMSEILYAVGSYGEGGEDCKWYDNSSDMYTLSVKFPGMLFTLSGEGEEGGDLWRRYWHNGCVQSAPAIITYEDFDPSKLVKYKGR